jgi:hypothetical protein
LNVLSHRLAGRLAREGDAKKVCAGRWRLVHA